jgi:hypothetical protein
MSRQISPAIACLEKMRCRLIAFGGALPTSCHTFRRRRRHRDDYPASQVRRFPFDGSPRLLRANSDTTRDPRPSCSSSGHPIPSSSTMTTRRVGSRWSLTWIVPPRSPGNACFKALVASSFTMSPIRIACRVSSITSPRRAPSPPSQRRRGTAPQLRRRRRAALHA